jgi:hypothetical protein
MLYQLPSGKTIEISTEKYLQMSDDDLQYFAAQDAGDSIENPFFGSSLDKSTFIGLSEDELDELIEDQIYEVPDIDPFEKLDDLDADDDFYD